MKKIFNFTICMIALGMISCTSNEQKANKLIKQYMFESLYDFKSYEPTKTSIDTLRADIYLNEEALEYAEKGIEYASRIEDLNEEVENNKRDMEFAASMNRHFSSSYGKFQYNEAKEKYHKSQTAFNYALREVLVCMYNIIFIKEEIDQNPAILSGWKVNHKYRCNTRGGDISLGEMIFIMDDEFQEILTTYDVDDMPYAGYVEFIKKTLTETDKEALISKIEELESNGIQ